MAKIMMDADTQVSAKGQENHTFKADGADRINLPSGEFIAQAEMTRDGDDLVLETPSGEVAVIEGYFSADPAPLLISPEGAALTPNLVESFAKSPLEFAANASASDESPVGAVEEVKGNATVTRADGSVETITIGTPIYEGDIVETDAAGAVNIVFMDETSMAISENARLAIDEYTFDPSTESGTTNFSVLRGLFVFTSGLIGRDDPDDVQIETPVGSIGIRGTVIAGEINPDGNSKITVLEGAIVVKNGFGDVTLSDQFETVQLGGYDTQMTEMGVVPANDISARFSSVGAVSPSLFTTINDAAGEQGQPQQQNQQSNEPPAQQEAPASETQSLQTTPQDIVTLSGDTSGFTTSTSSEPVTTTTTTATQITSTTESLSGPITVSPPPVTVSPIAPITEPPVFKITAVGGTINDIATAGTVIATLSASGIPGVPTYTFGNGSNISGNGHFEIVGRTVVLTTAGQAALSSNLDVVQLGGFNITATAPNGRVTTEQYNVNVVDAHNQYNSTHMNGPITGKVAVISDSLNNQMGYSITALGDTDNDGFDDFAFTNNTTSVGQNHIYKVSGQGSSLVSGNIAGVTTTPNPTLPGDISGTVMSGIGDFDGDGTEDYVIGQLGNNINTSTGSGAAAIVSGANGMHLTNNITFSGTGAIGWQIGASVDGIGDMNNDGYADVIIGAPGYGIGGGAYVVEGGANWSNDINTATSTGTNWQRLESAGGGIASFGASVAGLGDFNGDGYSDFAVGSPTAFSNHGAAFLYHGTNGSIPTNPVSTFSGTTGQELGQEVSSLGDINGDGLTDLLVGGEGNVGNIYFGRTSAMSTADITLNIPTAYTITGGGGVGDFNGDGYDDFAISVADANSTNTYVVFGKDFGANTTIDLSYLKNPQNAYEIRYNGATSSDELEVSGIGDVNGDGYDDFAIGVPDANGANAGNGGVTVIYGRNTGSVTTGTTIATADNQALVGSPAPNTFSDGDFDGVSMRGGAGNDTFLLHNTNFLGIDGGGQATTTYDRILVGADLDFSDVNFEKISGIEMLQFDGSGQTVTLTLENIFNLLKTSDTGFFKIDASAANTLNIDALSVGGSNVPGAQIAAALNEMSGNTNYIGNTGGVPTAYRHFEIGGYDLYIDNQVTVNVV